MNKTSKSSWRTLYAIGAVGIALMFVVPLLNLSDDMQKVAFLIITAALWAGMGLWISGDRDALGAEEPSLKLSQQYAKGYYTLNPGTPSSRTSRDDHEKEVA